VSRARVDEPAAHAVAAWYVGQRHTPRDPQVRAAYAELEAQTDALLRRCLRAWGPDTLRVVSTALVEPYDGDRELVDAVRTTNVLEVPRVPRDRAHPVLDSSPGGPYDRMRAVHDLLGHVVPGFGFDREGEFAAWIEQDRHYRGRARAALATELHGQHSVLWSTGELAEPKAMLIDRQVLRASVSAFRRGSTCRARPGGDRRGGPGLTTTREAS
jgi:hypothetical protein